MTVIIIAALTKNLVIGNKNKIPWHIPEDFKKFKFLTSGQTTIVGRNTFESIGKPFPNRNNIIVSSAYLKDHKSIPGVEMFATLPEALDAAKRYNTDIFICGGHSIYKEALSIADKMYLSWVKKEYEGDTFFPKFDETKWTITYKEEFPDFTFTEYEKKQKK